MRLRSPGIYSVPISLEAQESARAAVWAQAETVLAQDPETVREPGLAFLLQVFLQIELSWHQTSTSACLAKPTKASYASSADVLPESADWMTSIVA